jgi:phospholipid/cholesterol/gamma-HCH transport system ATP-binding protein
MKEKHLFPIRRKMGMVFQGNALFDSLTVTENLSFFLRENLKLSAAETAERIREQIEFAGLKGFEHQFPETLSGGMKKRLAIGRALIFGPEMVLLDEPTVGLDPLSTKRVLDVILQLKEGKGLGAVFVTHLINDVFGTADRVIVLYEGKIIFNDEPQAMHNSDHPFVESFLSNSLETA